MESVRISPIVEYDQTFVGRQDCDSARKTTLSLLCILKKKNIMSADETYFDHCNFTNLKLYLTLNFIYAMI